MATPAESSTTADMSSMNMSFQEGSGAGTEAGTGDGIIGSKFPASSPFIPVVVDAIVLVVDGIVLSGNAIFLVVAVVIVSRTVLCVNSSTGGVVVVLSSTHSSSKT